LLNELEKFFIFIVTQIYNLVADNLYINTSRISFTENNNKLVLSDIISVDTYNLDIESKNSVIQNNLMQRICTIYLYDTIFQVIVKTKIDSNCRISYILIKKDYCIKLDKCEVIDNIFYFRNCIFVSNSKRLRTVIIQYFYKVSSTDYSDRTDIYKLVNRYYY